jgi:hypothetical protein
MVQTYIYHKYTQIYYKYIQVKCRYVLLLTEALERHQPVKLDKYKALLYLSNMTEELGTTGGRRLRPRLWSCDQVRVHQRDNA